MELFTIVWNLTVINKVMRSDPQHSFHERMRVNSGLG